MARYCLLLWSCVAVDTAFSAFKCLFSVGLFRFAFLLFSIQCLCCSEARFSDRIRLLFLSFAIQALPLYFAQVCFCCFCCILTWIDCIILEWFNVYVIHNIHYIAYLFHNTSLPCQTRHQNNMTKQLNQKQVSILI